LGEVFKPSVRLTRISEVLVWLITRFGPRQRNATGGVSPLEYFLTEPQLTIVRAALSEPFNDFPVEYDYVANQVRGVTPETLYEILYSEVAPVCFTNLVAAVPPIWTGFDPDKLRKSIEERLAARERNWFRRQFDKVLVRWLKYNYAYIWKEIASRL
jgi:hypothetical protein